MPRSRRTPKNITRIQKISPAMNSATATARAVPNSGAKVPPEEGNGQRPGFVGRGLIRASATVLLSQESVSGALEEMNLVRLPEPPHDRVRARHCRIHALIVASVQPEDWDLHP